jgi:multiple sugar transport system substrate-binding protein
MEKQTSGSRLLATALGSGSLSRRRFSAIAAAALALPVASSIHPTLARAQDVEFPTEFPDLDWPTSVNEPTEKVSIHVANAWDPQTLARQEFFDAQFMERHPNIEVRLENTPWSDFRQKYVIQGAGGSLPDVMYVHFSWAAQLINNQFLRPLEDHISQQAEFDREDFVPTSLLSYTGEDGQLYALPYDESPGVLFYNKEIFDSAGVEYPSTEWTLDTLKQTAINLTSGEGGDKVFGFGGMDLSPGGGHMAPPFLHPFGARYTNPEETESFLASDETIQTMEWWMELLFDHGAMPGVAETEAAQVNPFLLGRVAMDMTGAWFVRSIIQDAAFDWDVAQWPAGPEAHSTFSAGSAYGITKDTEQPDAAWIYLNEYTSTAGQTVMGGSTGLFTPSRRSAADAYAQAFTELYGNESIGQVTTDSLEFASAEILRSPVAAEVQQIATAVWDSVLNGDISVADGLRQIDAQIAPLLEQNL